MHRRGFLKSATAAGLSVGLYNAAKAYIPEHQVTVKVALLVAVSPGVVTLIFPVFAPLGRDLCI